MSELRALDGAAPVRGDDGAWEHGGPYVSYASPPADVNWSDELEELHEESSRDHFIDVWTRTALIERLAGTPGVIVDLGCSTGYLLEDLRRTYPSATLYGLDLIAAGLEKAHDNEPSAALLQADVCDLPFLDASVDAVVSANLLEHVPDDEQALREIRRVLRPGGRAVIIVPAGPSTYDYYDRFLGHERRYARRELAGKAAVAGLEVVEDGYVGSLLYPPFWLVKQRNRRKFANLAGTALHAQVAADIERTQSSSAGAMLCRLERQLLRRSVRIPFGVRSLVTVRRPEEMGP